MPNNMLQNEQKRIVHSLIQGKDGAAWATKVYFGWNMTSTGESFYPHSFQIRPFGGL
jgi:hypothetical protein